MTTAPAGGPPVGAARSAPKPTTRRRAAGAATIPVSTMRRTPRRAPSQGHPAAHPRCAVSTREYRSGGRPTHSAATRRAPTDPRGPPCRRPRARRCPRFLTARRGQRRTSSLRCGRSTLTPPTRRGATQPRRKGAQTAAQDLLDRPFHISTPAVVFLIMRGRRLGGGSGWHGRGIGVVAASATRSPGQRVAGRVRGSGGRATAAARCR
jgi:hypothetical protein